MITGYEGYTVSEIERKARAEDNNLALELIERIMRTDSNLFQQALTFKPRTKYKDGTTSA